MLTMLLEARAGVDLTISWEARPGVDFAILLVARPGVSITGPGLANICATRLYAKPSALPDPSSP